jgi:predicted alpha/beta-fold hydrolase
MPIASGSTYRSPPLLGNGHFQTVWPALFRKIEGVFYRRERIATPDGDFLDLDWLAAGARRTAILLHGLEGRDRKSVV